MNKAFQVYQKLFADVQTQSLYDRGEPLPHQAQYVYRGPDLFPAEQELSPEYIERTNRRMHLDMQKVSNYERFAAKQMTTQPLAERRRHTTQHMHLRNGKLVDPPFSTALTRFDHKKLDAVVQSTNRQADHSA